jgi:hypothetical protein
MLNPWLLYFLCWIPAGLLWTRYKGGVDLHDDEEVITLLAIMGINPVYLFCYMVYRTAQALAWCFNLTVR